MDHIAIVADVLEFTRREDDDGHVSDVKGDPGDGDIRTAIHSSPPGEDSFPLTTDQLVAVQIGGRWVVVGYLDPVNEALAEKGEKRFYARDADGEIVATFWMRADGKIEVPCEAIHLGDAEGAAKMSRDDRVQEQLDRLKSELEAFKSTFDAHSHVITVTSVDGDTATAAPPASGFPAPASPGATAADKVYGT